MNLGALLWLLLCPAARAVGNAGIPGQQPPTVQELAQDLGDGDAPERRFAARSLRGMVRQDVRRSARANAPDVDLAEARLALQVYDDLVAPACIEALTLPDVLRRVAACTSSAPLGSWAEAAKTTICAPRTPRRRPSPLTASVRRHRAGRFTGLGESTVTWSPRACSARVSARPTTPAPMTTTRLPLIRAPTPPQTARPAGHRG